jgi:hypothetical protein
MPPTPITPTTSPSAAAEAIVANWLQEPDAARSWEASYAPLVIDGDRAVASGETVYTDGRRFSNLFVLRFDADGRCSEFVEWFIENPAGA